MAKKVEIKTIKLSVATWKALQQMKLDNGALSMEELVKGMVRDAGY
jgi:hypothetical protein